MSYLYYNLESLAFILFIIQLGRKAGQYQEVEKNISDIEAKLRREEFATAGDLYLEKVSFTLEHSIL